jgi:hypothetical protein
MKYITSIAAAVAVFALPASAETVFKGTATSGTAANPLASIVISAKATTSAFYVDPASGPASNKTAPAIQLTKDSQWTFDFTDPAAVKFKGNIVYGDYRTQTSVTGMATIDGRQSYEGVTQSFSGSGTFDPATNTLTYTYANKTSNGGGASTQTQKAASCVNGKTSMLGEVCKSFASATPAWEGLSLKLVFAADKSSFTGTLQATDTSGSGLTAKTTEVNWQVAGTAQAGKP